MAIKGGMGSDESDLGVTRKSPLELPQRSYVQPKEEEIEGIPSTVMEMQKQRQREERMKATAEQLVGAPVTPTVGEALAPAEAEEAPKAKRKKAAELEQEEETPSAADFYAEQRREAKKREALAEKQQTLVEERQQQYIKAKRKIAKEKWDAASAALALTSISGIGFIAFVMMKNVQLLNQFTVKDMRIPEPSIPQIGLISCTDLVLCCTILPILLPGCFIIAVVAGAAALIASLL